MSAITEIPAKTPRPIGNTDTVLPGISNFDWADSVDCSAAAVAEATVELASVDEELAGVAAPVGAGDAEEVAAPAEDEAAVLEPAEAVEELLTITGGEVFDAAGAEELLTVGLAVPAAPVAVESPFTTMPEMDVGPPALMGAAEELDGAAVATLETDVAAPLPLLFKGVEVTAGELATEEGAESEDVVPAAEDVTVFGEVDEVATVAGAEVLLVLSVTVDVAVSITVTDALPVVALVAAGSVWVGPGGEGGEGVLPIASIHVFSSRTRGSPFGPTIGVSTIVQTSVAGPWGVSIVRVVVTVCAEPVTSPSARARISTPLLREGVGAART